VRSKCVFTLPAMPRFWESAKCAARRARQVSSRFQQQRRRGAACAKRRWQRRARQRGESTRRGETPFTTSGRTFVGSGVAESGSESACAILPACAPCGGGGTRRLNICYAEGSEGGYEGREGRRKNRIQGKRAGVRFEGRQASGAGRENRAGRRLRAGRRTMARRATPLSLCPCRQSRSVLERLLAANAGHYSCAAAQESHAGWEECPVHSEVTGNHVMFLYMEIHVHAMLPS